MWREWEELYQTQRFDSGLAGIMGREERDGKLASRTKSSKVVLRVERSEVFILVTSVWGSRRVGIWASSVASGVLKVSLVAGEEGRERWDVESKWGDQRRREDKLVDSFALLGLVDFLGISVILSWGVWSSSSWVEEDKREIYKIAWSLTSHSQFVTH